MYVYVSESQEPEAAMVHFATGSRQSDLERG
jgi:hypothetical protein